MPLQVEGFAIVSDEGMIADERGVMPASLHVEADERFFFGRLAEAALIVHGRNSREHFAGTRDRPRLIATRRVATVAPMEGEPRALLWNPAGLPFEAAVEELGVREGMAAVLGGPGIYGLFLPRYDTFNLSHAGRVRLPGGLGVFPEVPERTPEAVLEAVGLALAERRVLDPATGVTVAIWRRSGASIRDGARRLRHVEERAGRA
jgi:hypothetical protein